MSTIRRTFAADLPSLAGTHVLVRGWVYRLRVLARTNFIIVRDCSGDVQCVAPTNSLQELRLKLDDAIEVRGMVRTDHRARGGIEIDIANATLLNRRAQILGLQNVREATLYPRDRVTP